MTKVKICGLKEKGHALAAARAGADFLGFIFAPGRRQITPETGRKIILAIKKLEQPPLMVGVFVNIPSQEVNSIASYCGLDMVQLSGDESWEYCLAVGKPVIKVIHVANRDSSEILAEIEHGLSVLGAREFICLLDSGGGGNYGGTGEAFDWQVATQASRRFRVIVAGGLTPENVAEAIRVSMPWGVDVSSGVETSGIKDIVKLRAFVEAVRRVGGCSKA